MATYKVLEWEEANLNAAGYIDPLTCEAVQTSGDPVPAALLKTIGQNAFMGYIRNMSSDQWEAFKARAEAYR